MIVILNLLAGFQVKTTAGDFVIEGGGVINNIDNEKWTLAKKNNNLVKELLEKRVLIENLNIQENKKKDIQEEAKEKIITNEEKIAYNAKKKK